MNKNYTTRESKRIWKAQRRLKWMSQLGACVECASQESIELHHKDPTLKVSHKIWSWREDKLRTELAKCVPLCHSCHLKETARQRRESTPHGSLHKYRVHGCRCFECTKSYQDYLEQERPKQLARNARIRQESQTVRIWRRTFLVRDKKPI